MTLGQILEVVAEWFPQAAWVAVQGVGPAQRNPPFEIRVAVHAAKVGTFNRFVAGLRIYNAPGDLSAALRALERQISEAVGDDPIAVRPNGPTKLAPSMREPYIWAREEPREPMSEAELAAARWPDDE